MVRASCCHHRRRLSSLLMLLITLSLFTPVQASGQIQRSILVLHSYHTGLSWTDGIMRGIEQQLAAQATAVRLHVEYMDTKRNPDPQYLQHFYSLLEHKLENQRFELLITSDNEALDFALSHRTTLFAAVPIVFCGVNNFEPQLIADHHAITGVAEQLSVGETVELALTLHPDSRELILIGSKKGATSLAINRQLEAALSHQKPDLKITRWHDISIEQLEQRVARLERGQLLFLSSVLTSDSGTVLSFAESVALLRQASPAPIYGYWDFFLGHGIVGGKLVSSQAQGRMAARLAQQILRGTPADELPVITDDSNVYLFDDLELQRFGITPEQLPVGSQRINQPSPFYSIAKKDARLLAVIGGLLVVLIGLLLWSLRVRRLAADEVAEKEERLRLAIDGSQDGFWDWDVVHGRNIVSERWCTMLGYRPDDIEMNIEQWKKLVHPDDLEPTTDLHRRCMAGEFSHFTSEFRMQTKDGQWKWILGRGMVTERDAAGHPLRLTGTHRDISHQKAVELALKEALCESETARNKIDAILRSLTDGLIVSDQHHQVVMLNQPAQSLLGTDSGQAIGRRVENLVDGCLFGEELTAILTGDKEFASIDVELEDAQRQELRIIQARFSPIRDAAGQHSGAITLLEDVTRSREMTRLKSEFISTAAHELRTPLTAILGFADLMLEQEDISAEVRREYLQIISSKSESLAGIVDDLLDLSRIESGRLISLDPSLTSLRDGLLLLVDQYRDSCPRHQFTAHLDDIDTLLSIDRNKMGQVFENLLSNAVKYSPNGGGITLRSERTGDGFHLIISDEGIGMTPAQIERIFDKFYRVDATNTAVGGLGLGMSIVKSIIEAHGGIIWIESVLHRGTSAHILLPVPPETRVEP